jgi:DNA-binding CsgD family transcriptional regulator
MLDPILLSAREAQVVTLLFQGRDKRQIAADLGIGMPTVTRHLQHVYAKAGVGNALELVALAWNNGGYLY